MAILGIDVSKWQGEIDWSKARSAGARFAFIRAGAISLDGQCYTDYQFERNSTIAPEYMPVGFYWYFRPQFDPFHQAGYFCNLIRDKKWKLPPVLDLENVGDPRQTPFKITDQARKFAMEVYNRLDEWILLYSRGLWLNENTIKCPVWDCVDVWLARYKTGLTSPWSDGACKPRDWDDWRFWQASAQGNGLGAKFGAQSGSIDIDYFNGDQAAFDKYVDAPSQKMVRVSAPLAVSVRSGPEGAAVGATWRGAEWRVLGKSADYYKVEGWLPADKVEEI